eukprot:2763017-Rhodomonas_salina.2
MQLEGGRGSRNTQKMRIRHNMTRFNKTPWPVLLLIPITITCNHIPRQDYACACSSTRQGVRHSPVHGSGRTECARLATGHLNAIDGFGHRWLRSGRPAASYIAVHLPQ